MTNICPVVTLSPRDYDAVLFDLDGVLTKTAGVHAAAWKRLFDEFLERRALSTGEAFVAFDIDTDYRRYVDGKPRYDGVTSFLNSRGIELPFGARRSRARYRYGTGPGQHEGPLLHATLEQQGVEIYEPAIDLVRTLREQEVKTAVVSSSDNCAAILEAAGISHLFDTRVDGVDIIRLALNGKPAPDAFLEAATAPQGRTVARGRRGGCHRRRRGRSRWSIRQRHRRRSQRAFASSARSRRGRRGDQSRAHHDRDRAAFCLVIAVRGIRRRMRRHP